MRLPVASTLILLLAASLSSFAQIPGLTKLDVNAGASSSYPLYLTEFKGKPYFFANENTKGYELRTMNSSGAPALVYDTYPLATSCIVPGFNKPTGVLNGKLYFTADNGFTGYELFVYDGTNPPTLAQDIVLGSAGSSPDDYASLNSKLYFRAVDNVHGYELWQYDPITTNTTRLSDICAGIDSSLRGGIIAYNNKIVFAADSGKGNTELFQYDPTSGNIGLIADIYPGTQPSAPMHFVIIGTTLYFTANDGNHGRELFTYDGVNPPQRITDIAGGSTSAFASFNEPMIASFAGKIYVAAKDTNTYNYNLFSIDGSNNATLAATVNSTNNSQPSWLTPYAGKLYFSAYNDTTGFEIWTLDSSNKVAPAFELCSSSGSSDPEQLLVIGNDLFFRANECLGVGTEIFRYDYKSVGIENTAANNAVVLYPNPAETIATIQLTLAAATELQIQLTDMTGRMAYTDTQYRQSGAQKINIPVSTFLSGNYIYHIYSTDGNTRLNGKLAVK
jgi:ELWxxDGT repeat protein